MATGRMLIAWEKRAKYRKERPQEVWGEFPVQKQHAETMGPGGLPVKANEDGRCLKEQSISGKMKWEHKTWVWRIIPLFSVSGLRLEPVFASASLCFSNCNFSTDSCLRPRRRDLGGGPDRFRDPPGLSSSGHSGVMCSRWKRYWLLRCSNTSLHCRSSVPVILKITNYCMVSLCSILFSTSCCLAYSHQGIYDHISKR